MPEVLVPRHTAAHNRVILSRSVILIAVASLTFSVWASFVGFHHSLFDFHGFRQSQTAISAEYMEHGGPFLRYQTPILGPPWSIPFEFPLYQKIVALIAEHFKTPLNETGRAVSIAFFYLCFFPLASILRRLDYKPFQVLAVLSLFAVSPLYIFVSRLFMIESTALFLSLVYADQMVRLSTGARRWRYSPMIVAAIFGSLAGVVKVTTFAPFLLLGVGLTASHIWQHRKRETLSTTHIALVSFFGVAVPALCTLLWTKFADAVKAENPIGFYFTSKVLGYWNFGTLNERLRVSNYTRLLHAISGQAGSLTLLLLLVLIYAVLVRRWNWTALVCLGLYVFTTLTFFNLHLIHEYYPYSSAIFLVVAAGLLIADLLLLPVPRAWVGFIFLISLIAACGRRYHSHYYVIQRSNAPGRPGAAAIIDSTTKLSDVVVITGLDWSSELPFQSHRRAIMDPGSAQFWAKSSLGPITTAIRNQGARSIPEVIVCDSERGSDHAEALLHIIGLEESTNLHADGCDIYLRTPQSPAH